MLHLYTVCPCTCSLCSLSLLLAPLFTAFTCSLSLRPRGRARRSRAARCARLPVRECAPADAWSTVDFFVRRPCAACLACPRVCSLRSPPVRGRASVSFQSPIIYILRRYARPAALFAPLPPPQTFLSSFSDSRYLFRCRSRRWMARRDVAIWAISLVLRCFDDLLTSHDIKKIFFKGVDSVRPSCYDVHVNRKDTHDRPIQARQARPTDDSNAT